jgi:hypothetical protein
MDPTKVEKIRNWPIPKNAKQVSSFLGLTNYYNHFIKNYADIAAPLQQLTHKNFLYVWSDDCNKAFIKLKELMCSDPVLRQPDLSKRFFLYTDASALSAGAILSQKDDKGEYVISYASRKFKHAELNYSVTEKECLAVLWAVKLYRIYLDGVEFTIITDHKALKWLLDITDPHGRLARWSIYLQAYIFIIENRPGITHTNADALSRVYTVEFSNNDQESISDTSQKSLDVWEDATLLYYLKHNKHKPGVSKKQIKRVTEKSEHYIYEQPNDKIWFTSTNDDKTRILEVPKIDDRVAIVQKQHLFAHMNARKTYDHLKLQYYWHNMMKTIESQIRRCIECLKHKHVIVKEHPAIALAIHRLMERIGIDLAFGLPETDEGYHGVLVITEYLSKYPFAVPIKSKLAAEIAEHLFNFISLFGPPELMLSDRGKEFINQLVDELLNQIGIEHVVTSSYHPRTDGLTEKYNQTLLRALRKHADDNPTTWPKWLPYCLMAYRDTIHSSTGYTPYELMFGRKMNKFINYNIADKTISESAISIRLTEIKQMFEETIPKAIENIQDSQKIQINSQNSSHHIQEQLLKIDDEVYIKVLKIHPKIDPDYVGPYFIDGITRKHNYWLRDKDGKRQACALPLSRLKLVEKLIPTEKLTDPKINIDDTFYDIETIIMDRQRNKKKEFYVKWLNLDDSQNSWVPLENFKSPDMIKEYFVNKRKIKKQTNTINIQTNQANIVQINFPVNTHIINVNTVVKLFTFFILMINTSATILSDNFMYCQINTNKKLLDINNICKIDTIQQKELISPSNSTELLILAKLHNIVNGIGFECKKSVTSRFLKENIFTYKSLIKQTTSIIPLTEEDCQYMLLTKRCENKPMICQDLSCHLTIISEQDYVYATTVEAKDYSCQLIPRLITAETKETILFGHTADKCTATKLFCKLAESIIIWSNEIIHECPFEVVRNCAFLIEPNNIVINETLQILLKVNNKTNLCNTEMLTTTEGLFIVIKDKTSEQLTNNLTYNHRTLTELTTINDLLLSDSDFKTRELLIIDKLINQNLCSLQQTIIVALSSHFDKYHIIKYKNEQIILYSNGIYNNIYIPDCVPVFEIKLIETSENCYADIPIQYKILNRTKIGFITHSLIIKDTSKITLCNHTNDFTILPKSLRIIERKNGKINILQQSKENLHKISFLSMSTNAINYQHNIQITEGIDIISQFQQIIIINDTGSIFKIIEDGPTTLLKSTIINHPDFQSFLAIAMLKHLFWSLLTIVIVVLIKISIIILLIKCIINYVKKCWKSRIQNSNTQETNTEIIHSNPKGPENKRKTSLKEKIQNIFKQTKDPDSIELKNNLETHPLNSNSDDEPSTSCLINREKYIENTLKEMSAEISKIRNQNKFSKEDNQYDSNDN